MKMIDEIDDRCVINLDLGQTVSSSSLHQDEEVKVKKERISEVETDKQISLDNGDTFRFSLEIKNDLLIFKLSEIGVLCPFIYERALSLEDLTNKNPVFKQCKTLKDVEEHIQRLFKQSKICLLEINNEITLQINAYDISKEVVVRIELKKVMTTDKDEVLNELYDTQKKGIKVFKELENQLKQMGLNDALEEFNRIKKKYKV